jgi:GT2 family glycosyltransferase
MRFSVIIPTCHRPELLAQCLRGLSASDVEIIVSDDSGDDATRAVVERDFPRARWVAGPRRGPAANRNHGARAAIGDWLAFVDDDCQPQQDWLAALERAAGDVDVVEGCTVAPGAIDSPFEEHVENIHGGVLWSCNFGIRRVAFERLGGFDEHFLEAGGEDMEFAWRVAQAGLRVRFAPDALVHHPPRYIGWRGLWRRTWMIRWMGLYRIKTRKARSLPRAIADEMLLLLRQTAQLVTRRQLPWPRCRCFHVAWRWLTFPLVLPYILYWDWRFGSK